MIRLRKWLFNKFLPVYCRDALQEENAALRQRISELKHENQLLHSYIDGMHMVIRRQRRIVIQNKNIREGVEV